MTIQEKINTILNRHIENMVSDKELAHMGIKSEVKVTLPKELRKELSQLIIDTLESLKMEERFDKPAGVRISQHDLTFLEGCIATAEKVNKRIDQLIQELKK